jgi:hypothetical protein
LNSELLGKDRRITLFKSWATYWSLVYLVSEEGSLINISVTC